MSNGPSIHVGQARHLVKSKDYEAAVTVLREGLEDDSSDRTAQEMLGVLLFRLKRPEEAAIAFRQLTRLAPRDVGTLVNLGAVLNMTKDYKGASDALRKAIRQDKACGVAYYNLAIAQKGLNQAKMAISAYEECLKLEPANTGASLNLANLLLEERRFSKAAKVTEAALEHAAKSVKLLRLQARVATAIEENQMVDSPLGRLVNEKELAQSQQALVRRRLSRVERNRERELMREMARELRHTVRSMIPLLDEALPKQMHTLHMAAARQDARNEGFAAFESLVATISELASVRDTVTESVTVLKTHLNKTDPGL